MVNIVKIGYKKEKFEWLDEETGEWTDSSYNTWEEIIHANGIIEELLDDDFNENNIRILITEGGSVWIFRKKSKDSSNEAKK